MDQTEMQYQVLAIMIKAGMAEAKITDAINTLDKFPTTVEVFDRCNLPYIISRYAATNKSARKLAFTYKEIKDAQLIEEQSLLFEDFLAGVKMECEEQMPSHHVVNLVKNLLQNVNMNCVRLAYRLLDSLNFNLDLYFELYDQAIDDSNEIVEAKRLVDNVDRFILYNEAVDEDMEFSDNEGEEEIDENDEIEENEELQIPDDNDDDINVEDVIEEAEEENDSGVESEGEELINERNQEEEEEVIRLRAAIGDIFMRNFAQCLLWGNTEQITKAASFFQEFEVHPSMYRKYEISRLIIECPSIQKYADKLLEQIKEIESETYAVNDIEVFNQIIKYTELTNQPLDDVYEVLSYYLMNASEIYRDRIIKRFLEKPVTYVQFVNLGIEEFLLQSLDKTDDMMLLIQKIQDLRMETIS
ncbi:hypothetical protein GCK72_023017 [Caenorhabditis remanei]|uniref:Uncharacterized protein n=1 Tax=Caenorhabditis remanei TaxID=31234 RepID=A0A6A5FVA3_CAERE|nr:hypothetical protein GCK72_023017 [Caenorhabditis remanei]KAF1746560.1 hypothetical protein GCK72_023017 [Caenorhabditis remanei]